MTATATATIHAPARHPRRTGPPVVTPALELEMVFATAGVADLVRLVAADEVAGSPTVAEGATLPSGNPGSARVGIVLRLESVSRFSRCKSVRKSEACW